ncbi:hypothetical protein GF361_05335 [Candidatus Woesearchaeota archaeon]|nr:hypothetical protein [Candidatus Woesearchaeota archaeon]
MKKRGQVTIFIIAGISLLLIIALLIMYQQQALIFKPEVVVPPEISPLQKYVRNCIQTTAEEGILLIGSNGGYIDFPDEIEFDPTSYISTNPLFREIKIPLWRYRGISKIPSESFIVNELETYIEENIDSCIQDLAPFQNLFQIESGEKQAVATLMDSGVAVDLIYPLKITIPSKNQTANIEKFEASVPLRLKTVYQLARDILEEENLDKFIETRTIDLIASDPEIPYIDYEFTCRPRIWKLQDVEAKLKQLLTANLPLIKVEKTKYSPLPENLEYERNHFVWDVTTTDYPDTHVSFTYDEDWPLDLHVRPNDGSILRSNAQRGQDILSLVCMHLWHFTYDVRYPFLVTVTDEKTDDHEKFTFNFGIEAGINHNRPDTTNFGITTFDIESPSTERQRYCSERTRNILSVYTFENISRPGLPDQKNKLPGVNISYTCMKYKCPMGQSEFVSGGAVAALSKEFPYCINGVLRGIKPGYLEAQEFVSTNTEKTAYLYLTPVTNKKFKVVKHFAVGDRVDEEEGLEEDESALIKITRNQTYKSNGVYPSYEEGIPSEIELLAKWDYNYELEITLLNEDGIIGGYKSSWKPSWVSLEDAKEITFHAMEWPYIGLTDPESAQKLAEKLDNLEEKSEKIPEPELT